MIVYCQFIYSLLCAVFLVVTKIDINSCASLKRGKTFFLPICFSSITNSNQNSDSSASSITILIEEICGSQDYFIVGIDVAWDKHHAFFGTATGRLFSYLVPIHES